MINYKSGSLSKKEKSQIESIINDIIDPFREFYITKDNLRLYLSDNSHLLFEGLDKKDKIIWGNEGVIFIHGYSDNSPRKYVKILSDNPANADSLLKILNWNLNYEDLFAKIKKDNPLVSALKKNGFRQIGDRGKEILMLRKSKQINFQVPKDKEGDE